MVQRDNVFAFSFSLLQGRVAKVLQGYSKRASQLTGSSSFPSVLLPLLSFPSPFSPHSLSLPPSPASFSDQRVRLSKQAIQGARTIKMSGWELLLEKRIADVREMIRRAGRRSGQQDKEEREAKEQALFSINRAFTFPSLPPSSPPSLPLSPQARKSEMKVLRMAGMVRGIHEGIYFFSPVLVGAATFLTDWGFGRELDASRVFSTLTLFNILQVGR